MNNENTENSYRWIILIILTLAMFDANVMQFQIAGLASQIIPGMHLKLSQFTMILGAPMLTSAIMGIPAGFLADRFGVKPLITIGLILATIGCFGRIGAANFGAIFVWMLLIGFANAFINANGMKLLATWFPREQMGTAMGIFIGGASLGITVALATSALFPSIQSAFMTIAVITVVILLLWIIFIKGKPKGAPDIPTQSISECLSVSFKSKNTWIASIAIMFWMGSWVTFTGNLSNALTQAKGLTPVLAGLVSSLLCLAFVVGSFIGPLLSDKFEVLKPFFTPLAILSSIFAYVSWIVHFGLLTWVLLGLTGILLGMYMPLIMSLPVLFPEIGPVYAGSAGGILSTLQMAGAFFIPTYLIIPLAGTHIDRVFLYLSVGFFICGLILFIIPDFKAKAKCSSKLTF